MKRLISAAALAAIASLLVVPAGPAVARDKVHRCSFWSWTGPASWSAVCSKQGITVSSPDGRRAIDWGFAGTYCRPGKTFRQSAANFMAEQRRGLKQNGVRFNQVGKMRLVGRNYYRQKNVISAGRGRKTGKGQAFFDYSLLDVTGPYCHQSLRVMMVPKSDYRRGMRQLNRIYHSMAYFGPGLPKGPNGEPA